MNNLTMNSCAFWKATSRFYSYWFCMSIVLRFVHYKETQCRRPDRIFFAQTQGDKSLNHVQRFDDFSAKLLVPVKHICAASE